MTISEKLFEELCNNSKIHVEPISTMNKVRTADYRIWLDEIEAIAEVKQIEKGKYERDLLATAEDDNTPAIPSDIHIRIQKKFQKARKQLKNLSAGRLPTLFVLYDNTGGLSGMDNETFLQAMHGNEIVEIYSAKVGNRPKIVGAFHTFGNNRKVRENLNTSISCFCRLLIENNKPCLFVYHNEFAKNPLSKDATKRIAYKQFIRFKSEANEYRNWWLV
ncbi:MAG: hypothetical protein ABSC53_14525 [Bacteroidota bacterium]